jgi:dCMP deaminase
MTRISREDMLLNVATVIAQRGTCQRLAVGAVIARNGRILCTGYNGAPAGLPHCSHFLEDKAPCTWATHAELNAITFAARAGVATLGAEMYATDSPCETCAKAIINAGIIAVYYRREYRLKDGLDLLAQANVRCHHHPE